MEDEAMQIMGARHWHNYGETDHGSRGWCLDLPGQRTFDLSFWNGNGDGSGCPGLPKGATRGHWWGLRVRSELLLLKVDTFHYYFRKWRGEMKRGGKNTEKSERERVCVCVCVWNLLCFSVSVPQVFIYVIHFQPQLPTSPSPLEVRWGSCITRCVLKESLLCGAATQQL